MLATWIIDGGLLYVLGTMTQNFSIVSKTTKSLLVVSASMATILVGSILLYLLGFPRMGLGLASLPSLLLAGYLGFYLGVVLLVGRNARWN
jgi:hypothetical protein